MLVLWGGATDQCVVDFETASANLEDALTSDGHFFVECVHNCGHAVPPVDPTDGMASLWQFALDHPYWLSPGTSPYTSAGMPATSPEWCGMGMGGATPRTGMCTETSADSGCPSTP
jgi:hypothetical protein